MISDRKIIEGCLKGKRRAHNALYKKYAALMMAVCMRYCKNREEAEDVLQDALLKYTKIYQALKMQGSFEGWIRRIMVNTAISNYHNSLRLYQQEEINEEKIGNDIPDNDLENE